MLHEHLYSKKESADNLCAARWPISIAAMILVAGCQTTQKSPMYQGKDIAIHCPPNAKGAIISSTRSDVSLDTAKAEARTKAGARVRTKANLTRTKIKARARARAR